MSQTRPLEQYRIFPIIAWTLVAGFAFFVYQLTIELRTAQAELATQISTLEEQANTNPADITNFTRQPQ